MIFSLNKKQWEKLEKWSKSIEKQYTGAIGGRFTYTFHPTTLGMVVKVIDEVTKKEIDLTDYNDW